jgi:hypothetical protein
MRHRFYGTKTLIAMAILSTRSLYRTDSTSSRDEEYTYRGYRTVSYRTRSSFELRASSFEHKVKVLVSRLSRLVIVMNLLIHTTHKKPTWTHPKAITK